MRFKQLNFFNTNTINPDMILLIDGSQELYVPNDVNNRHWKMYQDWLSLGNQPEAAD